MLSREEREKIRKGITEKIKTLKTDIKELSELTKPIPPENAIGRVSRMDAINNKSVNEAALRNSKNKLAMLEYALSQIDQENFGKCLRCGKDIPMGRILLMPESRKCTICS